MTKVKHAVSSRKRRKRTLDATKGQRGSRSRLFKIAKEAARKSLIANYIDRKDNKGNFRALWITRISAACKAEGVSYSKFIAALKKAGIELNRKMIADLAMNDSKGFKALIKKTSI